MVRFIFGKSAGIKELEKDLESIAKSDIPIYIDGETGTGKTLLARKIHEINQTFNGLFIYLDCATIASSLMESELFGHEKGAFTGATESKSGLFELACGGTVFLDEVENLDLAMQAKLLRVLEEKTFRRVGGAKEIEVYFRLISASNIPIKHKIFDKTFRQDLYFRLKGINVSLPPLRERKEDIMDLANHFLKLYNFRNNTEKVFSKEVKHDLLEYTWPGNIRELKACIEEAAVKSNSDEIGSCHFSLEFHKEVVIFQGVNKHLTLDEVEKRYMQGILDSVDFNKTRAAKIMDIGIATLYRKMEKYNIQIQKNSILS